MSYADFVIVGYLQMAKRIDEELFARIGAAGPSLRRLYEACAPWLERDDH